MHNYIKESWYEILVQPLYLYNINIYTINKNY